MDRNAPDRPGQIELRLRHIDQLFNSMDPSPFIERDLAHEAEEFIVSWAREHGRDARLHIVLHLDSPASLGAHSTDEVTTAIHHYFAYRARLKRLELRELFRQGRASLAIGLLFLTACLLASRAVAGAGDSTLHGVVSESLVIGGWVAMWRPLEIYLYDWWPVRRAARTLERLAEAEVEHRYG